MGIQVFADQTPDKPALIAAWDDSTATYEQLNRRSIQVAKYLRKLGLKKWDRIAVMLENHPRYYEICWAAQRSALYYVPINWHLTEEEAAYIINDSGAQVFFTSRRLADVARRIAQRIPSVTNRLMTDGIVAGFDAYEDAIESMDPSALNDELEGNPMYYSSGTTGKPKGILRECEEVPFGTLGPFHLIYRDRYGFDENTRYLCPAPLYHAAPLGWSMAVQRFGGTVVLMERFDPVNALELIEKHRITHAQFVPTMFIRMLKLAPAVRNRFDVSSLRFAVHAAAPCPIDVKEQMIDWWGPILYEYYAGSEGNGLCAIESTDWLAHKGSVGRPLLGTLRIVGDAGELLSPGQVGTIYFEGAPGFAYHNDADRTADAVNARGWSTLGDMGYVDEEGYLYLTDRKSHMIISGGVNIYPQEVESVLALHPKIHDVAVIGVPNAEFGEEVKAVVQPAVKPPETPALEAEIIAYCRERLAHYKCPKSVDFVDDFPRLPNGKLLKRRLRDRYWTNKE